MQRYARNESKSSNETGISIIHLEQSYKLYRSLSINGEKETNKTEVSKI